MEYYAQDSPPPTQSSYSSGGGSYNFNNQIAVPVAKIPSPFFNYQQRGAGSGAGTIYAIDICIDGTPMKLDVYVAGAPYAP